MSVGFRFSFAVITHVERICKHRYCQRNPATPLEVEKRVMDVLPRAMAFAHQTIDLFWAELCHPKGLNVTRPSHNSSILIRNPLLEDGGSLMIETYIKRMKVISLFVGSGGRYRLPYPASLGVDFKMLSLYLIIFIQKKTNFLK